MFENGQPMPLRGVFAIALLLGATASLALPSSGNAGKVGVAAAVNPDAFSSLSGVPNKQLNIGKSIFYNERIKTTTNGLVQVLLVDGSTFTVGPNSNLVIDKFVYDPSKKTGEMVATFSKGSMRFIGGKLSKNDGGVKVNTPSGALAIRGGMFQGNTQKKIYSFLFGHSMTLRGRNGKVHRVYQAGNTLDMSRPGGVIRPTTAADTAIFAKALSPRGGSTASGNGNGAGQNAGGGEGGQQQAGGGSALAQTVSLQNMISDATSTATATEIDEELMKLEEGEEETRPPTNDPTPKPTPTNDPMPEPETEPEPIEVELRVLTPPENRTVDGQPIYRPEDRGFLGRDDNPDVTADDFVWTFTIKDNRLVGTITGLVGAAPYNEGTEPVGPVDVDFPAEFPAADCLIGVCEVRDATITHNGKTKSYRGFGAFQKDFFAYHITESEPDYYELRDRNSVEFDQKAIEFVELPKDESGPPRTVLAFGGKAHKFGKPRGRTYAFLLTQDVTNESFAPFSNSKTAPTVDTSKNDDGNFLKPQPSISPLLFKEKTDGKPESEAVWLQTSLYIKTTPKDEETYTEFDQESFINVALGGIDNETGGMVGARRGGSRLSQSDYGYGRRGSYTFKGDIESLGNANGDHFLGSDAPNVVVSMVGRDTQNDAGYNDNYYDDYYDYGDNDDYVIPLAAQTDGTELANINIVPETIDVSSDQVSSTTHVGVGLGELIDQPQTFDGTFDGYASGMIESGSDFRNEVTSLESGDFKIGFDKDANTLWADVTVFDLGEEDFVDSYNVSFGDNGDTDVVVKSAYVDDLHYAALENGGTVSGQNYSEYAEYAIDGTDGPAAFDTEVSGYIASGDQLGVTDYFPEVFEQVANEDGSTSRPFCKDCDFIKWGSWGARFEFGNDDENKTVDNVHLGWWVAGDNSTIDQLNLLKDQEKTATYKGNVIGNVANRIGRDGWATYVAAGKLDMDWNFSQRSGNFAVSKFDSKNFKNGLSFGGTMASPGDLSGKYTKNQFSGNIAGTLPNDLGNISGKARGSFVNDLQGNAARGVIGSWNVNNKNGPNNYKATGIFAGSGRPGGQ